jgi:hypothetical protein
VVAAVVVTQPRSDQAAASPTVAPTSSAPTSTPTPTVAATTQQPSSPSLAPPATAEQLADRLGDALEASDYVALRALIDPAGFFYQLANTGGGQPITPDETIDRLKRGTIDGRLRVQVARRPILPRTNAQPPADSYIVSTWLQYDNRPTQRVDLMLKNQSGRWFWSGGLFNQTP